MFVYLVFKITCTGGDGNLQSKPVIIRLSGKDTQILNFIVKKIKRLAFYLSKGTSFQLYNNASSQAIASGDRLLIVPNNTSPNPLYKVKGKG